MQRRPIPRSLLVLGLIFAFTTGCGTQNPPLQIGTALSGNWTFTAPGPALALNVGFTQGAYETVSAVARLNGASCVSPTADILLSGSVGGTNQMTLISSAFSGTTLTVKGQVAPDGKGITAATWSFTGGTCASLGTMNVTATNYTNIGGNYTGNFVDSSGNQLSVTAFLQQTTQPDQNGQFSLSGSAAFPVNTCFVQQPTITQSLVTGSNLSMTYTDASSGTVLTASGTFNSTASQLTITNWTIAGGPCNGDLGTGSLTQQ